MSLLSSIKKRSTLDAAVKQIAKARKSEAGVAEQLYKGAYSGFASVVADNLLIAEALYHWGFGLLHEAKQQEPAQALQTLEDAISKFSFCLLTMPQYLGAAVDGGVAFMELARLSDAEARADLYKMAQAFFEKADNIQKGSSAYNLACIHALSGDEEACLAALQLAKDCGSLPDEAAILQDPDMVSVLEKTWFTEFLEYVKQTATTASAKLEKVNIDYEPKMKIKKSEDFDYYSKKN